MMLVVFINRRWPCSLIVLRYESFFAIQEIPLRRSLTLHNAPFAGAAFPFIFLAPVFRFGPNLSRALENASFTKIRLPITAPSVK